MNPTNYTGVSIVDYLKQQGQPSDYASRATLAASKGIKDYSGSVDQNTLLLSTLRGGGTSVTSNTAQQPSQQSPQQQPAQQQSTAQQLGLPAGSPQSIQDLISMGYGGYQGWNDEMSALADYRNTGGAGKWTGGSMGGTGGGSALNLTDLYDNLYKSSGVTDLDKQLADMTTRFNEAQSTINDNPFLSESSRVGRIQKLQTDFNNATANVRDQIATKRADIEMQLNLATKQFDIDSQMARDALNKFNSLLESGALAGASGTDIANITSSTGLSSSMIQAAIKAQSDKNNPVNVSIIDDGSNQIAVAIDSQGNVVNKQTIAKSEPTAEQKDKVSDSQQTQANVIADIQAGVTLFRLQQNYVQPGGLTLEEVYRLYNTYSPYGEAQESIEDIKKGTYVNKA